MQRAILLLPLMAIAVLFASGVALAKGITGTSGPDRLVGTNDRDTISGGGNNDDIFGRGGNDRLYGDSGADLVRGADGRDDVFGGKGPDDLFGNAGNDYINAADNRGGDVINCGPGYDMAVYNVEFRQRPSGVVVVFLDELNRNCEMNYLVEPTENVGARSATSIDVSTLSRAELDEAVEAGVLKKVE